jgi:hypothetical protein
MDNINDAYDRKHDVRPAVEELEQFVRAQQGRLRKFEPKTASETSALDAALNHSEETLDEIREVLKTLPRTERKSAKP